MLRASSAPSTVPARSTHQPMAWNRPFPSLNIVRSDFVFSRRNKIGHRLYSAFGTSFNKVAAQNFVQNGCIVPTGVIRIVAHPIGLEKLPIRSVWKAKAFYVLASWSVLEWGWARAVPRRTPPSPPAARRLCRPTPTCGDRRPRRRWRGRYAAASSSSSLSCPTAAASVARVKGHLHLLAPPPTAAREATADPFAAQGWLPPPALRTPFPSLRPLVAGNVWPDLPPPPTPCSVTAAAGIAGLAVFDIG